MGRRSSARHTGSVWTVRVAEANVSASDAITGAYPGKRSRYAS
jgi:hypothetical protein